MAPVFFVWSVFLEGIWKTSTQRTFMPNINEIHSNVLEKIFKILLYFIQWKSSPAHGSHVFCPIRISSWNRRGPSKENYDEFHWVVLEKLLKVVVFFFFKFISVAIGTRVLAKTEYFEGIWKRTTWRTLLWSLVEINWVLTEKKMV